MTNLKNFLKEQIQIQVCWSIAHISILPLTPILPPAKKQHPLSGHHSVPLSCSNLSSKLRLYSTAYSSDPPDFKTNNGKWCSSILNINLCPLSCSMISTFLLELQHNVLEAQKTLLLLNCQRFTFPSWLN